GGGEIEPVKPEVVPRKARQVGQREPAGHRAGFPHGCEARAQRVGGQCEEHGAATMYRPEGGRAMGDGQPGLYPVPCLESPRRRFPWPCRPTACTPNPTNG